VPDIRLSVVSITKSCWKILSLKVTDVYGLLKSQLFRVGYLRKCFNPPHFTDIKVIDSLIWASIPRGTGNGDDLAKDYPTSCATGSSRKLAFGELRVGYKKG
jgi:hypothetical protein